MKYSFRASGLIAALMLITVQGASADPGGSFSLESGVNYLTGTYGGTQSTDILYVPVTGKYRTGPWTLKLTVPYLQITGPSNVINGIGQTGTTTSATRTARSGLGDVIAAVSNTVYNDTASGLMANLTGKVKFGTASSAQGLGTGKNDYAVQSEVYRVSNNVTTFGTLGYQMYGQPGTYTIKNAFYGWVGGNYSVDKNTSGGIMLNLGQKITTTGSSRVQTMFFVSHKLDRTWKAQGYLLKGFTNSVASWGAGASLAYQL